MIYLLIILLAASWLWGYTYPLQRFSSHLVILQEVLIVGDARFL